jgi:predicted RNA binding protein YcfA (HicA-like mRNA interferase family)
VVRRKKVRDLLRILRKHDPKFEVLQKRGKGSEMMVYHPGVNGRAESFPVTHHAGQEIGKGMLKAIIRRFDLPEDIFS